MAARHAVRRRRVSGGARRGAVCPRQRGRPSMCTHGAALTLPGSRPGSQTQRVAQHGARLGRRGVEGHIDGRACGTQAAGGGACGGRQIMCTHEAALTLHENRPGSQTGAWKGARLGRRGRREADRWTRMRCVGSSGVRRRVENWRGAHPRGLNGRRSGVRRRRPFWRVVCRQWGSLCVVEICIRMCMH